MTRRKICVGFSTNNKKLLFYEITRIKKLVSTYTNHSKQRKKVSTIW